MRPDTALVVRDYVDGMFGQLHLRRAGMSGEHPALLCIHMSPMSGRIFEPFLAEIGTDRLAIAPDTPGFGLSDGPPSQPAIADYAAALSHLVDTLEHRGPVDVIGYHTGAMIGPELAIMRPDRIRRLIMISALIFTPDERVHMRSTYRQLEPQLDGSHVTAQWKSTVYWNLHGPATLDTIVDLFPERLAARRRADWGHMAVFDYPLAEKLPLINQPILVLNPKDDVWNNTQRAPALLRNGRLLNLPGWGHGFLTLHASEAASMVRSFLDAPDDAPFGFLKPPEDALIKRDLPTQPL